MGGKLTFNGGIHPYDGKDLSKDKPIRDILPKGDLVYPLSQHIGAPAKPVVKKGDKVKIKTIGYRVHFFNMYPILYDVSRDNSFQ